jgi:hypothetical protein
MSKEIYLYSKDMDQLQVLTTDQVVYIPEEDLHKIEQEHGEALAKHYGRLSLDENDKLKYEEYQVKVLVQKEYYYFTETMTEPSPEQMEGFFMITVPKSVFAKYDEIRQDSLNGTRQVMYFDNDFQVITIPEGYKFDYKTKKVVKDIDRELQGILFRLDKYNLENEIKYNGFPFEINGKKYLQPFRGTEDRSYYSTLKNDLSPDQREVKFFIDNGTGVRDSSNYDLVTGPSLSDLFLEGMILKIIKFENALKPVLEKYWEEIQVLIEKKDLEGLNKLYENRQKEIIKRLEDEINK